MSVNRILRHLLWPAGTFGFGVEGLFPGVEFESGSE
jgi:hypothetical protein